MIKAKRRKHIKDYKKAILKYVKENAQRLAKEFIPRRKESFMKKALIDINWVRTYKGPLRYDYEIIHEFDCRPYKGHLKAYIYTTPDEFSIENTIVQTE
jgi:hypothetical protein